MSPREEIETQIEAALATITTANGYDLPRTIRSISRAQETLDQVLPVDRPALRLWTQEEPSEFFELARSVQTQLLVSVAIYDSVLSGENPAQLMNRYAAAVRKCLMAHLYWDGVALYTQISGVTMHDMMKDNLPVGCKTTVAATITYIHEDAV